MEMSMNVLAMFVANALKLKKNVMLHDYEDKVGQKDDRWWENDTYKHVITTIMPRVNTPFFFQK